MFCFFLDWEIRHISDGCIASQLGRLHENVVFEAGLPRFSAVSALFSAYQAPDEPALACNRRRDARNNAQRSTSRSGTGMITGTETWRVRSNRSWWAQGITLPESPRAAMANYVGFVRTGNLLFVSGQVCADGEGKLIAKGKLGAGVTIEQGYEAAKWLRRQPAGAGQGGARRSRQGGARGAASAASSIRPPISSRHRRRAQRRLRPDGRSVRRQGPSRPHHRRCRLLPSDAAVEVEAVFEVS